ncbi:MAG: hypothetical protein CM15mV49_240 [uncultured marine virus]|nr:MAG: hypothetical protein CM15mV49_240 [uncultured marine virus]
MTNQKSNGFTAKGRKLPAMNMENLESSQDGLDTITTDDIATPD